MEMLELRDLHKTFNPGTVNEKVALNGVSLTMEAGDFAPSSAPTARANPPSSTPSPAASSPTRAASRWAARTSPSRRNISAAGSSAPVPGPLKGTAPNMTIEENLALAYLRAGTAPNAIFSRISRKDKEIFREKLALLDMGLEDRMKQPVGCCRAVSVRR